MNVKLVILQLRSSDNEENESLENVDRALELCENYVQVYEKISPGYTKWRGHVLELQSAALLKKSQLQVKFLVLDICQFSKWYSNLANYVFVTCPSYLANSNK